MSTTAAAKKAWATRRTNEALKAKAEAELARKRTAAAKKAWATRKANGN